MYKHILVATDGSDVGSKGVEHGLALARSLGAKVTLITVTEPYPLYAAGDLAIVPNETRMTQFEEGRHEVAEGILTTASRNAQALGVETDTLHIADAEPAEAIIETAKQRACDLIIMGSHGRRGIGRLVLGSKAWEVVAHGHVPVLVVR